MHILYIGLYLSNKNDLLIIINIIIDKIDTF